MDQSISRGDDLSPGNLRVGIAHFVRNTSGGFSYQFEVTQCRIVGQRAGNEGVLIEPSV